MACNCGKKGGGRETFVATFTDGTTRSYNTEIEARVATQKKGGTYKRQVSS
jgi:hypothetical protein